MKLSNFTQGRDNNFNLIRVVAALTVLIAHSVALASGNVTDSLVSMSQIALDVFFITSGFLVTASLLNRQSVIEFVWARVLRVFPALLIMLLLTVFGLGVFFTSLPLSSYFANSNTYIYLLKCATLITGVSFFLPGVFHNNPLNYMVNGSLWTMPYEVKMYAILAVIWVVLRVTKMNRLRLFQLAIVAGAFVAGVLDVARPHPLVRDFIGLFYMFFSGAAFFVLRRKIALSRLVFWLFVIALLISAVTNKNAFLVIYELTIAYVLIYVAYIPSGWIRKYNQVGDYSYGIYIYAWPVQQSVAALIPGVSVLSMISISGAITILLAALSWHLLERRALGLKNFYVGHTRRILRTPHDSDLIREKRIS